jgi:hypothetical protein
MEGCAGGDCFGKLLEAQWRFETWSVCEFPPPDLSTVDQTWISDHVRDAIMGWARVQFCLFRDEWSRCPYSSDDDPEFDYRPFGRNTLPLFVVDRDGSLLTARLPLKVKYDSAGHPIGFKFNT